MSTGKKKPPIDLRELEEDEDVEEEGGQRGRPGNLSYMEKSSRGGRGVNEPIGGRDWKGLVAGIIVAVFLTGVLIFVATPSKKDISTLQDNQKELTGQFMALQDTVQSNVDKALADVQGKVDTAVTEARSAKSSLDAYALKGSIPAALDLLQYAKKEDIPVVPDISGLAKVTDVATLQASVTTLQAQVDALQDKNPSTSASDVTRWNVDISAPSGLSASYTTFPSRIEEDDYYDVDVTLEGTTVWANSKIPLTVTLTPVSRTTSVFIDESNTYIEDWSDIAYKYTPWTTVVSAARDGTVRRITFTSTYTLTAVMAGVDDYYNDIMLELSLAYK